MTAAFNAHSTAEAVVTHADGTTDEADTETAATQEG